jgi:hypothetical protein
MEMHYQQNSILQKWTQNEKRAMMSTVQNMNKTFRTKILVELVGRGQILEAFAWKAGDRLLNRLLYLFILSIIQ